MQITLDPKSISSYRQFLDIKKLPAYRVRGRVASFPDEYANRLGVSAVSNSDTYKPEPFLFDYQAGITAMAIAKRKFAVFADCGLGKSLMLLSYAKYVKEQIGNKRVLIITPPMVVRQLASEAKRFWGEELPVEIVKASGLQEWLCGNTSAIGITNYEALKKETIPGNLGCLILDESSILKSHYGNYAGICIELGRGLEWKLCLTGTPAPNDRIEYANHGVFLDRFPTINSFLATYFINRGQTQERWALKPHALRPFYRSLSDWCIFLTDPSVYGWKDNCGTIPPINVHIEHVELTDDQRGWVNSHLGSLIATRAGGIQSRGAYGQVAKGNWKGKEFASNKPEFIKRLIESWPDESTLVWCLYNEEQQSITDIIPQARSIDGSTPFDRRRDIVDWFCGRICDCELDRRLSCRKKTKKITCGSTMKKTSLDGPKGARKNKKNTTKTGGENIQKMRSCENSAGEKQKNGKRKTKIKDSHSDCESTALRQTTTTTCSMSKTVGVQYVAAETIKHDSTSTIATQPCKCAACCADSAISGSESLGTAQTCSTPLPPICSCTLEQKKRGRVLVSKPAVLGFGLNLQIATRQVFSGLQDSYESYYQCVKRSNRIGSTKPLNVHIPVTELEEPMIETVLTKAHRIEQDTKEQELLFKELSGL